LVKTHQNATFLVKTHQNATFLVQKISKRVSTSSQSSSTSFPKSAPKSATTAQKKQQAHFFFPPAPSKKRPKNLVRNGTITDKVFGLLLGSCFRPNPIFQSKMGFSLFCPREKKIENFSAENFSGRALGGLWESSGRALGDFWETSGRLLGELWESSWTRVLIFFVPKMWRFGAFLPKMWRFWHRFIKTAAFLVSIATRTFASLLDHPPRRGEPRNGTKTIFIRRIFAVLCAGKHHGAENIMVQKTTIKGPQIESKKGLRFCWRHDKELCPSSKAERGGYCVLLSSAQATGFLTLNGPEACCDSLSSAQATGSLTGSGPETYCVLLESQQATGPSTLNGPEPYCVLLSGAQATGF